jgi:hypothetical protein
MSVHTTHSTISQNQSRPDSRQFDAGHEGRKTGRANTNCPSTRSDDERCERRWWRIGRNA